MNGTQKPLKVRVTLVIEVDTDTWEDTYGVERIWQRDDVRKYVVEAIQNSAAADEGAIRKVTPK